jgi:hypothetical protein
MNPMPDFLAVAAFDLVVAAQFLAIIAARSAMREGRDEGRSRLEDPQINANARHCRRSMMAFGPRHRRSDKRTLDRLGLYQQQTCCFEAGGGGSLLR